MSNPAEYLLFYENGDDEFGPKECMTAGTMHTIEMDSIKTIGFGLIYFRTYRYPLDEEELDEFRSADQIMERKFGQWWTIIKGGVK